MESRITIYSDLVWLGNRLQPASIEMTDGKIREIYLAEKRKDAIDYSDDVIMPGVIDPHAHINEPGRTDWEGFETATQAAAAGGITTVVDMPLNSSPVTTNVAALLEKKKASEGKLNVNVGFYGGLIQGNAKEMKGLIEAGILGVKSFLIHSGIDDFPEVKQADLDLALPILARHDMPFLVHCELAELLDLDAQNNDPTNYNAFLQSRPVACEVQAIDWMIECCRTCQVPLHIVHLSAAEGLDKIIEAKKEGLPLTVETCTHYIYFDSETIPDANTLYKCCPPIRAKKNNTQLKAAIKSGVIDFLSTDHSPAPPNLKEIESGNIKKAWGGIAGLQFLLSACWTALKKDLSLETFIPKLTTNTAKFLRIDGRKGKIALGYDADITIWSPEEKFVVKKEDLRFRHKISPYIGQELFGKITATYVNGIPVFENDKFTNKNAGQWLLREVKTI